MQTIVHTNVPRSMERMLTVTMECRVPDTNHFVLQYLYLASGQLRRSHHQQSSHCSWSITLYTEIRYQSCNIEGS
jgi:hypothetical protein